MDDSQKECPTCVGGHIGIIDPLIQEAMAILEREYSSVSPNWKKFAEHMLSEERERERLIAIRSALDVDIVGRRILNVGSGFGLFDVVCRQEGADSWGIEPDYQACLIASALAEKAGHSRKPALAVGEHLPFCDNTFDLVVSFQVLEHTSDPQMVLAEIIRVLKPAGYMYCVVPSYFSF
jgi:SAM-dependent methyltransferase